MSGDDTDGFIGLPPGIADSGTHRLERPERPRKVERDEIVFFPAAPGTSLPTAPESTLQVTEPMPAVDDATRVTPSRHAAPGWRLVIVGGEPVTVDGLMLLGRNPAPTADRPGARLVPLDDATKSVSKTHALLEVDAGELFIHDLDSTNGVWVVPAGAEAIQVLPGTRAIVPAGSNIELGDFVIQVEKT